ncbi:MAG: D-sedoheptulose-7-phosphate isomerase [Candidatus Xenobia bacterium]
MELAARIEEARQVFAGLTAHDAVLREATAAIVDALRHGHRILTCGNGGSSAEAMHLSTELVGRYEGNRVALPAVFLGGDATLLTCIANDFGYDEVFSRPLEAHGQPGDILVAFTTSGRSPTVNKALQAARDKGIRSLALLGKTGGEAKGLATWEIIIASHNTARIQEAHQFLLHAICDGVERAFEKT